MIEHHNFRKIFNKMLAYQFQKEIRKHDYMEFITGIQGLVLYSKINPCNPPYK